MMMGAIHSQAQDASAETGQAQAGSNSWEAGLHAGHFFTSGNVDFIPGYGAGIHVRRALDYVFSLRLDMLYGSAKGEDKGNARNFSNKWMSGSLQAMVSLNNLKWATGERRTNFYALTGVGFNSFSVDFEKSNEAPGSINNKAALHTEAGAGLAFRINSRVNIGLEHKSILVLGARSDLPDGFKTLTLDEDNRGTFRDAVHYTSVRLNVNLGSGDEKDEPMYWLNPLDAVLSDISGLRENAGAFNDEDSDGVFDKYDRDNSTAPGTLVNSHGETPDSDNDRIIDQFDKEPFSPAGYPVDAFGVAKVPQLPDMLTETERRLEAKIEALRLELESKPKQDLDQVAMVNLLLPTIYFATNGFNIGGRDLVQLETVARMLRQYPEVRLVVIGHCDKVGKESYNLMLSYNRAKAIIDFLVNKYGIARDRFVLQYKGNSESLVNGSHEVNRRVQLRIVTNEGEMAPPLR